MREDWIVRARRDLARARDESGAWGYRPGSAPSVEPTVLACLARLSSGDADSSRSDLETSWRAAAWMAEIQGPDGSIPVTPTLGVPGWSTSYAILLWCVLKIVTGGTTRAQSWLLANRAAPPAANAGSERILGDDPTLTGWPWVDGTHSWIEPTAMAILALARGGQSDHPRVKEGLRLIRDRALDHGGWNCGNRSVFGHALRPLPGPTGMSLLALATEGERSPAVSRAVDYLLTTLPRVRAPLSLGWGVLALRAYRACPAQAECWLAEAFNASQERPLFTMNLALLLLAARGGESHFIGQSSGLEGSS